ncbi:MAG: cohesin domain-containing protein [Euryarchaeota archaeon]|nr:cohesin domain-containing protein [Euryarchaeota archaeon]
MEYKYSVRVYALVSMLLLAYIMPAGAMTMFVDDTHGNCSTSVDIPINVSDASDVGAMDIALTYDSDMLIPTGIVNTGGLTTGALVMNDNTITQPEYPDWTDATISGADNQTVWDYGALANYTGTSGVVNISIICNATDIGFNGAGPVTVVQFRVIGSGGTSSLNLSVTAYNVSAPILNATDPDKIDSYDLIPVALVNGTFEAMADGLPQTGDIDGSDGITMNDVIHLAKHFYGPELFPDYATIYADGDIDCDGDLTMNDVIYLAKHFYGPELFPDYATLYPCT